MLDKYQTFFSKLYEHYKETGKRTFHYVFTDFEDKQNFFDCYEYLEECGYVTTIARAIGLYDFKLTPYGIEFAENGYSDPAPVPVSQGDNSIYVQGSNNAITNNYNRISTEIEHSELSEECKQMIEAFLYDMGNPHNPPEKIPERIKSFLLDITSGALSETATSGLTTLFTALFRNMHF